MSDLPPELPGELPSEPPEDSTPALPSAPSPIPDDALPAVADQLRPLFEAVVNAAVSEAIKAVPTPTLRPGTVTAIDMATMSATVTLDEGTEQVGTTIAQIISETPIVNDRVMVMFVPPSASYVVGIVGGSGVPAGVIAAYTGTITSASGGSADTAPPRGWLWAYGQDYESSRYPALWRAIGTLHGTSSAQGSGKLPDMRGRMPLGLDNMGGSDAGRTSVANSVGTTGGAESHSLSTSNMPSHAHGLNGHTHSFSGSVSVSGSTGVESATHTHQSPDSTSFWTNGGGGGIVQTGPHFAGNNNSGNTTSGQSVNHTHGFSVSGSVSGTTGGAFGSTEFAGSGSSVNHLPPYLAVHWIIKA